MSDRLVKANILIDEQGKARITDFGLLSITESKAFLSSFTAHKEGGSVRWMAPELFADNVELCIHTAASDVWACGCLIIEVISRSPPSLDRTDHTSGSG